MRFSFTIFTALLVLAATASGNSYSYSHIFPLPKSSDVTSFTNGLPPATGKRLDKAKKDIIIFLDKGIPNLKPSEWLALQNEQKDAFDHSGLVCDGVFIDSREVFYFWTLISPSVLRLQTPSGQTAFIQMPPQKTEQGAAANP